MRFRRSTGVLIASAALGAALLPGVPALAATTPAKGTQIKIAHSGMCLNVAGASTANNAKIVQYGCSAAAANDKFVLVPQGGGNYWIRGVASGRCLNVDQASTANKAPVIQYTCGASLNTLWKVQELAEQPTVRLLSANSGKCLNLPNSSVANNVQLIQYTCSVGTTVRNEQFYLPPTTSAVAVRRPYMTRQPVAALQDVGAKGEPIHYSWIGDDHQLTILTDRTPDPADPAVDAPVVVESYRSGYTGRTQIAEIAEFDRRMQVVAHDAATGDVILSDETASGTGIHTATSDIGGAMDAQPVATQIGFEGPVAVFAVINGSLWYAPETATNSQPPYGAWRSLGGTGLTGTPAVTFSRSGVHIYALTAAGTMITAEYLDGTLSDWVDLGGAGLNGVPSAVTVAGYVGVVTVRSADGTILVKRQRSDGTYPAAWTEVGDLKAAGSPSIFRTWTGALAVAARESDGAVSYALETRGETSVYNWTKISDPARPETYAANDPTVFEFDFARSSGFGIVFPGTQGQNRPVVALVATSIGNIPAPVVFHSLGETSAVRRIKS